MFPESKSPLFLKRRDSSNGFAKLSKLAKICEELGPLASVHWHCWSSIRSGDKSDLIPQARQP